MFTFLYSNFEKDDKEGFLIVGAIVGGVTILLFLLLIAFSAGRAVERNADREQIVPAHLIVTATPEDR
jgi:hypothetical protein